MTLASSLQASVRLRQYYCFPSATFHTYMHIIACSVTEQTQTTISRNFIFIQDCCSSSRFEELKTIYFEANVSQISFGSICPCSISMVSACCWHNMVHQNNIIVAELRATICSDLSTAQLYSLLLYYCNVREAAVSPLQHCNIMSCIMIWFENYS